MNNFSRSSSLSFLWGFTSARTFLVLHEHVDLGAVPAGYVLHLVNILILDWGLRRLDEGTVGAHGQSALAPGVVI